MEYGTDPVDEFATVFNRRQEALAKAETASDFIRPVLERAVQKADEDLAGLAEKPEIRAYYGGLAQEVEKRTAELAEIAPLLRDLGLTDELQAKEAELANLRSSERMTAAGYFATELQVVASVTETVPAPEPSTIALTPDHQPNITTESAEPLKQSLQPTPEYADVSRKPVARITIDREGNIVINQRVVLEKRKAGAGNEENWEVGHQLRLDLLMLLANNPGRSFTRGQMWEIIRPGQEIDRGLWSTYAHRMLAGDMVITHSRRPLINITKLGPKLSAYGITEFNPVLQVEDRPRFTLPGGKAISGKLGNMLNLLDTASADEPISVDGFVEKLYGTDPASMPRNPQQVVYNMLSSIRQKLSSTGLILARTGKVDDKTGYYLASEGSVEAKEAFVTVPVHSEAQDTSEPDAIFPVREAAVFAAFLSLYEPQLKEAGLPPLPQDILQILNQRAVEQHDPTTPVTADSLNELRKHSSDHARMILHFDHVLEGMAERLDPNDPRYDFIIYLMDLTEKQWTELSSLVDSSEDTLINFDPRQGYQLRSAAPDVLQDPEPIPEQSDEAVRYVGDVAMKGEEIVARPTEPEFRPPKAPGAVASDAARLATAETISYAPPVRPARPPKTERMDRLEKLRTEAEAMTLDAIETVRKAGLANGNLSGGSSVTMNQVMSVLNVPARFIRKIGEHRIIQSSISSKHHDNFTLEEAISLAVGYRLRSEFSEKRKQTVILETVRRVMSEESSEESEPGR